MKLSAGYYAAAAVLAAPVTASLPILPSPAQADEKEWRHGLSLFGDLKYPADFKRFDYVNPAAPKGGTVRQIALGTFDNFNLVVSGVKGTLAGGVDLIYDTLMVPAFDEVSTEYGLLAEAASHPADFSSVTYRLRANAKWHDGKPVTWKTSSSRWKPQEHHRSFAYYRHVTKAERTGKHDITFVRWPGNRELPQIVGQLNVLPKHWWGHRRLRQEATSARPRWSRRSLRRRRFREFNAGRNLTLERVKDY